ncbi:putative membrane protein [Asticcacaulis biprosthecium C19]|uniref:Putative membrane protein n=1 Tax=Asticcacaulis biprosthecium C19 TaxID=715226 RepID=F4QPF3_9CAUL|nr:putative membrane protein [Asticcacaulis biprosthecium C19]
MAIDHRDLAAREVAIGMYDEPAPKSKKEISVITAFPLLLIPWFVYNVLAVFAMFSGNDAGSAYNAMIQPLFSLPMPSPGTKWTVSISDIILLGALICLFFELLKSTKSDKVAIINHSLSMVLFIVCLVEFLLLRPFATSTFFLLTSMTLMDVLAGFIVTAISARKDIDFGA